MPIEKRLRNVVISGYGGSISKDGDLICITTDEGVKHRITPKGMEQLIVAGEVSITSSAVRYLVEEGVDLVFVHHRPNFFARVIRGDKNIISDVWRRQIHMNDMERRDLAHSMIDAAIYNRSRMLSDLSRNYSVDLHDRIERLDYLRNRLHNASLNQIRWLEGEAAKTYYQGLRMVMPDDLGFRARKKHPPTDPVNSMLSYGYTVLASRVEYALMKSGLNPYEGILHMPYRNSASLSYDLMEEFRQVIVDRVVMTLIKRGYVSLDRFSTDGRMCMMVEDLKRLYLDALYTRFEDRHRYRGGQLSYLDIIFEQAKLLRDAVIGNSIYRGFKWR